jgi:hypothetical protein
MIPAMTIPPRESEMQEAGRAHLIPSDLVPERAGVVAFLGNQTRGGDWMLPRLFRAVAALGSVTIDLTRVRVGPGTSHIEVRSIFGNVEIIVPPTLRLECRGTGVLGNFEADTKAQRALPADAPVVVVDGTAFLGNVEVRIVDPNAPGFIDRLMKRITK